MMFVTLPALVIAPRPVRLPVAETALALSTLVSGKNYDFFGYVSSGALAIA